MTPRVLPVVFIILWQQKDGKSIMMMDRDIYDGEYFMAISEESWFARHLWRGKDDYDS